MNIRDWYRDSNIMILSLMKWDLKYRPEKIIAEIGRPGACGKYMSLQRMFHLRHNAQSNGSMSVRETLDRC